MPTQSTTYNSRVTDEALEKRFRDTFKAQGGAELVDDLYASGVIVPVVDFTPAAEGSVLREDLQKAWDFATGHTSTENSSNTIITNAGFWKLLINIGFESENISGNAVISITDGLSSKIIYEFNMPAATTEDYESITTSEMLVFLRSGDSLIVSSNRSKLVIDTSYRQIATVTGDLVNPSGFTSS